MAKNISIATTIMTAIMATTPAVAGYPLFQNEGRQGFVSEIKAVGRRWMNAVAIRTPVPKCRDKKRNRRGMGRRGNRRAIIGNEHAKRIIPNELALSYDHACPTYLKN